MSPTTGSAVSVCEVQPATTDSAVVPKDLALCYFLGDLGFEQSSPLSLTLVTSLSPTVPLVIAAHQRSLSTPSFVSKC